MRVYGVLNIVAHPHPEGTYRQIFDLLASSRQGFRFYGDRFAAISPLSRSRDGVFTGRLATWTQIDRTENIIDIDEFEEKLFEDSGVTIPESVGFNSKIFGFAFNEKSHRMIIETENADGQSISIKLAASALKRLVKQVNIEGNEYIEVFVSSRKDALEKILNMKVVKKVIIDLSLPNPDDLSEMEEEILKEMIEGHIKRDQQILTKRAGSETMILPDRPRAKANLAKDNGSVKAIGMSDDGDKVELSTEEYPEELYADEQEGGSPLRRLAGNG